MKIPVRKKMALILAATMMFVCLNSVSAQHVGFIYGHAAYDLPVDKNFTHLYNSGLGVEGGGGIGWGKTFIVGTIGYTNFFHKNVSDDSAAYSTSDLHYIPFKVGLRQYILMKMIYIHGDLGIGKIKNKDVSESRFSGDIGAGVKFAGFEAELVYDGFTRENPSGYASWIGIKAGIAIGL